MKHILSKLVLGGFLCLISSAVYPKPILPALFSDNMILQQKTEAPIWGTATPGKKVKITGSWNNQTITVQADKQGNWKAVLQTPVAGGPYNITISDGKKIELSNVMIGEVWICSGQSNMEMPLGGWGKIMNYEQEIAAANHPGIRLFQIKKSTSLAPSRDVQSTMEGWQTCSPQTVENFSSVAYFYARELNQKLGIPVGVIDVTWGGTIAEAWTSAEALSHHPDFKEMVKKVEQAHTDRPTAEKAFQAENNLWQQKILALDKGFEGQTAQWAAFDLNTPDWKSVQLPAYIEKIIVPNLDGIVWFRKTVDIPESWLNEDLKISLGPIDDEDICYFNGTEIGRGYGYNVDRYYNVPKHLLKKGKNILTVRVNDTGGEGGIYGNTEKLFASNSQGKISLAGVWICKVGMDLNRSRQEIGSQPVSCFTTQNYPTLLYNAMIHPLVPYAIQGAIWYQGESNEQRGYQYRDLLSLLIRDWRNQWNRNFPFYIVQLANFRQQTTQPGESQWAEVREAQKMALDLENTGMAVINDIGDAGDIHPKNKQEVGRRLSLIALANTYGQNIEFSGPLYESKCIRGNVIELSFKHTGEGLVARGGSLKGFTIAGPDHYFHPAQAEIKGDKVIVSSPEVPYPVAVRYSWGDNVESTLYNKSGLPASPFRTDDYPGITFRAR